MRVRRVSLIEPAPYATATRACGVQPPEADSTVPVISMGDLHPFDDENGGITKRGDADEGPRSGMWQEGWGVGRG